MPLGTNQMTVTTEAVFIPEIWRNEMFPTFEANLVLAPVITRMSHTGQKGDTIHLATPSRSDASLKVANTEVTLVAPTQAEITVLLNRHFEYSFVVEDIVALQANPGHRIIKMRDAGYALARQIDTDLWSLESTFQGTTRVIGSDGSTAFDPAANTNTGNGAAISDAGFRRMNRTLDDQDTPAGQRWFAVPPIEAERLMAIPRWTEHAFIGPVGSAQVLLNGQFGMRYGVPVLKSTQSPVFTADDTTTQYRSALLGHLESMVLIDQLKIRMQTQKVLEFIGDLFVSDENYGFSELRDLGAVSAAVPNT